MAEEISFDNKIIQDMADRLKVELEKVVLYNYDDNSSRQLIHDISFDFLRRETKDYPKDEADAIASLIWSSISINHKKEENDLKVSWNV
jgi:hypothetical protein